MSPSRRVVFTLFPEVTQLDFTAPLEVLSRLPGAECVLASSAGGRLDLGHGLVLSDLVALKDVASADILLVPGGFGVDRALDDAAYLRELRRLAQHASVVASVCTGSLLLGAAGLLRGKRAACHWAWRELLTEFGATPDPGRVVRDENLISGGGVTAGLDLALSLLAELESPEFAQAVQLGLEYAPAPPFSAGRPESSNPEIVRSVRQGLELRASTRRALVARVARQEASESLARPA